MIPFLKSNNEKFIPSTINELCEQLKRYLFHPLYIITISYNTKATFTWYVGNMNYLNSGMFPVAIMQKTYSNTYITTGFFLPTKNQIFPIHFPIGTTQAVPMISNMKGKMRTITKTKNNAATRRRTLIGIKYRESSGSSFIKDIKTKHVNTTYLLKKLKIKIQNPENIIYNLSIPKKAKSFIEDANPQTWEDLFFSGKSACCLNSNIQTVIKKERKFQEEFTTLFLNQHPEVCIQKSVLYERRLIPPKTLDTTN